MRIRVILRGPYVRVQLARKNKDSEWLAEKLSTSTVYLCHLLAGRKTVSPVMRERLMLVFRGHEWDKLFQMDGL